MGMVLTGRKPPKVRFGRLLGCRLLRYADRMFGAGKKKEPPRSTRLCESFNGSVAGWSAMAKSELAA